MTRLGYRLTIHPRKIRRINRLKHVHIFDDSSLFSSQNNSFNRSRGKIVRRSIRNKQERSISPLLLEFSPNGSHGKKRISTQQFKDYGISSNKVRHEMSGTCKEIVSQKMNKWDNCVLFEEKYHEFSPSAKGESKYCRKGSKLFTRERSCRIQKKKINNLEKVKNWKSLKTNSPAIFSVPEESLEDAQVNISQSDSKLRSMHKQRPSSTLSLPIESTPLNRGNRIRCQKLVFPSPSGSSNAEYSLDSGSFGSKDIVDFSSSFEHGTPCITADLDVMAAVYSTQFQHDHLHTREMAVDVPSHFNFPPFNPSLTSTPNDKYQWVGGLTSPRRLQEKKHLKTKKTKPIRAVFNIFSQMCSHF